jgi:hypothetical protein
MAAKRIADWQRPKEVIEVEAAGQLALFGEGDNGKAARRESRRDETAEVLLNS